MINQSRCDLLCRRVRKFKDLIQSDVTNIPEFFLRNPVI